MQLLQLDTPRDRGLKQRGVNALVRLGVLTPEHTVSKRTWHILLLAGNAYAFILLFGFALGALGETSVALLLFGLVIYHFWRIGSIKKRFRAKKDK